jgi:hypothetical protein
MGVSHQLVLSFFSDLTAADDAADRLKGSGAAEGDAIGVLALDAHGKLIEEKVGGLLHRGLRLSAQERQRIARELGWRKAAVGVLAHQDQVEAVHKALSDLGGAVSAHEVVDEGASGTAREVGLPAQEQPVWVVDLGD